MALAAASWVGRVLSSEASGRQVVPGLKWTAARCLPRVRSSCVPPPPLPPPLQPLRLGRPNLPGTFRRRGGGWRSGRGEHGRARCEGCCGLGCRRCHHQHRTSSGCQKEREEGRRREGGAAGGGGGGGGGWVPEVEVAAEVEVEKGGGEQVRRRRGLGFGEAPCRVGIRTCGHREHLGSSLEGGETWSELCPLKC